jgi:hypothetical protein
MANISVRDRCKIAHQNKKKKINEINYNGILHIHRKIHWLLLQSLQDSSRLLDILFPVAQVRK